jgi:hypothetical protein
MSLSKLCSSGPIVYLIAGSKAKNQVLVLKPLVAGACVGTVIGLAPSVIPSFISFPIYREERIK